MTNLTAKDGLEQPITYWTPSIAVCAIDFYVGDRFPRWKNDLLVSSLAAEDLRRLRIDGDTLVEQEVLFKGVGRLRDVVVGPDGLVYVAFNVPDRIARLVPVP
jgi:glucose/arabinose dehydrogenase